MPVTVLIPLITACLNLAPLAAKDVLLVLAEIQASKEKTVTPAHVAAISAAVARAAPAAVLPAPDLTAWASNHAGE